MSFSWARAATELRKLVRDDAAKPREEQHLDDGQRASLMWMAERLPQCGVVLADEVGTARRVSHAPWLTRSLKRAGARPSSSHTGSCTSGSPSRGSCTPPARRRRGSRPSWSSGAKCHATRRRGRTSARVPPRPSGGSSLTGSGRRWSAATLMSGARRCPSSSDCISAARCRSSCRFARSSRARPRQLSGSPSGSPGGVHVTITSDPTRATSSARRKVDHLGGSRSAAASPATGWSARGPRARSSHLVDRVPNPRQLRLDRLVHRSRVRRESPSLTC